MTGATTSAVRILFAGHSLAAPRGGGELSARTLLVALARQHRVEAACVAREPRDYTLANGVCCVDHALSLAHPPAGLPFHLAMMALESRFRPIVRQRVHDRPPDLLLLQQPACLDPADIPDSTRVVIFMRSLVCYGAGDANPSPWRRAIGRPFRAIRLRRNRALLDRADLIISNSQFLRGALMQRAGLKSHVIAPFIEGGTPRVAAAAGERAYLTFVGLDAWKGAALALRLAETMPNRQFLFLDGPRSNAQLRERARRLTNVTCMGWRDDMDQVFAKTRVLLMPSLWEEPFGRLPVEAGICGVPTVASARGGLPESVGPGGFIIDPSEDLGKWVEAIGQLDEDTVYTRLSQAARAHAGAYNLAVTRERFDDLIRQTFGLELGGPT